MSFRTAAGMLNLQSNYLKTIGRKKTNAVVFEGLKHSSTGKILKLKQDLCFDLEHQVHIRSTAQC